MNWLRDLWESRDAPREKPTDIVGVKEREKSDTETEDDDSEASGEIDSASGPEDEKQTLQFGRVIEADQQQLIGFCEVQKRGFVEACQWRVEPMKPRQKGPTCKIKF